MRMVTHSDNPEAAAEALAAKIAAPLPGFYAWMRTVPEHTGDCDDSGCAPGCAQAAFFGTDEEG